MEPTAITIKVFPESSVLTPVFLTPQGTLRREKVAVPQCVHRRGLWSALHVLIMFRERAPWPIQRVEISLDPATLYNL